ncbi:MAG: hypothetical protein EBV03_08520 [Proteobacteria bacterium]|nr:hypothetical protein [Pseudomonadota bacterium]
MRLLPLFLAVCVAAAPAAADPSPAAANDKRAIGAMMEEYTLIAGGWYLDKKCGYLSPELKKEFEEQVSFNTSGMHIVLGASEASLRQMQEAARETAEGEHWGCDNPKTRDVVVHAVANSRKLNKTLSQLADSKNP